MAKTVNEYKMEIIKVLKAHRLYSKGLDMQVLSLASAMRNLEMANEQIDGLTETTVWEKPATVRSWHRTRFSKSPKRRRN